MPIVGQPLRSLPESKSSSQQKVSPTIPKGALTAGNQEKLSSADPDTRVLEGKCTPLYVQSAVSKRKYHSSHVKGVLYTVGIVTTRQKHQAVIGR